MTEQDISLTGATGFASPLLVCANTRNQDPTFSVGFAFLFLHHRRLTGKRKHTVRVRVWNNLHRNVNHLNRYYHYDTTVLIYTHMKNPTCTVSSANKSIYNHLVTSHAAETFPLSQQSFKK